MENKILVTSFVSIYSSFNVMFVKDIESIILSYKKGEKKTQEVLYY